MSPWLLFLLPGFSISHNNTATPAVVNMTPLFLDDTLPP